MKTAINLRLLGLLACCLIGQMMFAQNSELKVKTDEATVSLNTEGAQGYQIDISGPNDYHTTFFVDGTEDLSISPVRANGEVFPNGNYNVQVTPAFVLTEEHQANLLELRNSNDETGITAYVAEHQLPRSLEILTYNVAIRDGKFISPTKHEGDMPPPSMLGYQTDFYAPEAIYASINYLEVEARPNAMDNSMADDQVFADDVIVQSSLCVGFDCVNGETLVPTLNV